MTKARILADLGSVPATLTATELGYSDGVTSAVQTQLTAKAPLASPTFTGTTTVSGDLVPSTALSHRNIIINGGMQVWQRGTALATTGNGAYRADRWKNGHDISGTIQNASETLSTADFNTTGHKTALVVSCSATDTSVIAGHQVVIAQWIEAQDVQHLQYGTANAQDLVVSFWAKADSAATYAVSLTKPNNTAYAIAKEFTVSTSWQQFTITFGSSDANWATTIQTAGGLMDNNTAVGLVLGFTLACGGTFELTSGSWTSTVFTPGYGTSNVANFADDISRKFHLTGVQLELGSNATPFEHRSYAEEAQRCYRYYWEDGVVQVNDTLSFLPPIHGAHSGTQEYRRYFYYYPIPMRANPTVAATGSYSISINNPANPVYAHCASDQGGDEGEWVNLYSITANAEL